MARKRAPLSAEQARQLLDVSGDIRRQVPYGTFYVEKYSAADAFIAAMIALGFSTNETAPGRIFADIDSWLLDIIG
jgi:hypothetical protein